MNDANRIRFLGTDDSVTTCDCCGRADLKSTVALDVDGEIVHFGCVCAARAIGRPVDEIKTRTAAADAEKVADRVAALALGIVFAVLTTWGPEARESMGPFDRGQSSLWVEHYTRHLDRALSPKRDAAKISKLEKLTQTSAARIAAWRNRR